MLYREIIAVLRSTQNTQTQCGQNTEFLSVRVGGTYHTVSLRLYKANASQRASKSVFIAIVIDKFAPLISSPVLLQTFFQSYLV
jgi:hypothetical protein